MISKSRRRQVRHRRGLRSRKGGCHFLTPADGDLPFRKTTPPPGGPELLLAADILTCPILVIRPQVVVLHLVRRELPDLLRGEVKLLAQEAAHLIEG